GLRDRDVLNLDGIALGDGVDVGALRTTLQRSQRNETEIAFGVDQKMGVDELIGEELIVFVAEDRLELIGAGGCVDLVVDGEQFAAGDFCDVVAIVGLDGQLGRAFANLLKHLRELILRKREDHSDRLHFGDDYQSTGVSGMNNVSGIDQPQANAS